MSNCYFCGEIATGIEHVPPKCLFPEAKDAFGVDYRKNLITVPSCDKHNLGKSRDDEFLMASITPVVGNNQTAFVQTKTKLLRAFNRTGGRGGRLFGTVIQHPRSIQLQCLDGKKMPVFLGEADIPRLCHVLEHIARGLYFHAHGERFAGKCVVIPGFVRYNDNPSLEIIKSISRVIMSVERNDYTSYGENPDVFHAYIGPIDHLGCIPMLMTFFSTAQVFVGFKPDDAVLPFRTLDEALSSPIVIRKNKCSY